MALAFVRRLGLRGEARRGGAPSAVLGPIGRRIRANLDSEEVVRIVVTETRRALGGAAASVWLTTGREAPQRASPVKDDRAPPGAETAVARAAALRRTVLEPSGLVAVPIASPRSGVMGAIVVEGAGRDDLPLLEAIAEETGYALESAMLYEQAVAGRERSEAILNRVGDAIVVTDANGTVREWNRAAEGILGVGAADAVGRPCGEVLGLHLGERALGCAQGCPLLGSRGSADPILGEEVWRERGDGRRQPLLATVSPVTDAGGALVEVVHSLRDVTRLKEADEAKTLFLATASHELKTPLTVIQGFAQLLSGPRLPAEDARREGLEAIERRAIQLNKIVDRLLLSSRIESGRAPVACAALDVGPIVAGHAAAFSASTGRRVSFESDQALPPAWGDADAVTTVLDHLLDNAVKYSPGGGPVTVRAHAERTGVTVSVTDPGIGMDPEQQARCFDKFWQAESSDVRRFGGTGIGLYIVRSLVEAMDGIVRVESEPGKGSTFTLTLPRADARHERAAASRPEEEPPPGVAERSVIREFMRQIGIPTRRQP